MVDKLNNKEPQYGLGMYGYGSKLDKTGKASGSRDVMFSGYINPETKELLWQHPSNKMLYGSEGGKPRGYVGKDKKFHFNIPDFGPLETRSKTGEIISQRMIQPGSLEDVYSKSPEMGPIANKYLSAKKGQKYHGWGFPKKPGSTEDNIMKTLKKPDQKIFE